MQYSVLALVTFFAAVMASPAKRQSAAAGGEGPTVQSAAMTTEAGDIVDFDSANVYLDSVAKGL